MKLYKNKEWLEEHYTNLEESMPETAVICNCCTATIHNWLKKFEIERRNNSESKLIKNPDVKYKNKDFLYEQYLELKKSMQEIAETCNCGIGTIKKWLKKFKIKIRSLSESHLGQTAWNKGKIGVYSPETLKQMSEAKKGHIPWNKGKKNCFLEKTLRQMSKSRKGRIVWNKGKTGVYSKETRKLMSDVHKGKMIGDKHPNWNPNRAEVYAPYGENFYNEQLRYERWNLQNGRDLLTGDKLEWGFYSKYHHIDWDKLNDNPDNHVWVNCTTHGKVHSKQKRKYYEVILTKNLQILKEGKIPESWVKKNKEMFRQEKLIQLKLEDVCLGV